LLKEHGIEGYLIPEEEVSSSSNGKPARVEQALNAVIKKNKLNNNAWNLKVCFLTFIALRS
jgi:hypothetical protein